VPDECEDCNQNGVGDACDISGGASDDCNTNGVPDDCEPDTDCNSNGAPDICDLADGTSEDCNGNATPDSCDAAAGGVVLDVDFEGGLPGGWTTSGIFQVTGACPVNPVCDGIMWAYAGSAGACAYGNNQVGELISPPITLAETNATLSYCTMVDTEEGFDFAEVLVNGDVVASESGEVGVWEPRSLDLSAYGGQTITITFRLASDQFVTAFGWQVDDITLISGSEDCDANDIPDECEVDSDGDGVIDGCDGCPDDINKIAPGLCGCGVPDDDTDSDGDGVADCVDACPGEDDNADADGDGAPDACDNCELPNPDQRDCQPNGVGDVCDLDSGTSQDDNGNGVPDECDPNPPAAEPGGPSCNQASDCVGAYQGADCVGGRCYVPKNRYLSIDPTVNTQPTALRVELVEAVDYPTAIGKTWWVDAPVCFDYPNGEPVIPAPSTCTGPDRFGWVSKLAFSAVPRVWTESPLHITGCGVVPVVTFEVRASGDGGASFSEPLEVNTIHKPEGETQSWGDITGGPVEGMPGLWLPPERTTNLADVGNAIRTLENRSEDTGFPSRIWVDVEIDQVINFGDVQFIVNAFEGKGYAEINLPLIGVDPTDCP
jgi:hypothetical protein